MPKPTNTILDKLLCTVFMTVYSGIGILAGIGVMSAVKNNIAKQEVPKGYKKESVLTKIFGEDEDK